MYSPDGRKEWYLEECRKDVYEEGTIELLIKIFNSAELEEKAFGKDISEFDDTEAIDYFKSLNSKSRARLKNTAWYLSRYRQWYYKKQNMNDILDPFDDRTIDKIIEEIIPDSLISGMYFGKQDVVEYLDLIPDYINKIILLSLFYGIKGDENIDMVNMRIEDLDEESKKIKLISGRYANVDDLFIEYMKKAHNAERFLTPHESQRRNYKQGIYVQNGYIVRPTIYGDNGEYDYKPVRSEFVNQRLIVIREQAGNNFITISNLYRNGLITFIKEKYEKQGISLKTAFLQSTPSVKGSKPYYEYDKETDEYIKEFGSKTTARMLRRQLKDYLDKF